MDDMDDMIFLLCARVVKKSWHAEVVAGAVGGLINNLGFLEWRRRSN